MAIKYDENKAAEQSSAGSNEEYHVPSGTKVVNLVSYVECGKHQKMYKGKPATYASGKNQGKIKPPEHFISMIFEFSSAPYTGDYPHAFITSLFVGGKFINGLSVSDEFVKNTLPPAYANKTGYKRYLDAINLHYDKSFRGLDEAVGMALAMKVDTVAVYKDEHGVEQRCADNKVPGYDKSKAHVNLPGVKYYTNIKPENIVPMVQDFEGHIIDLSNNVHEPIDNYTPVFDWDEPTVTDWKGLKSFQKAAIVNAVNFRDSKIAALIMADEELQEEVQEIRQGTEGKQEKDQDAEKIPETPGKAGGNADMSTAGSTDGMAGNAGSNDPELPCD